MPISDTITSFHSFQLLRFNVKLRGRETMTDTLCNSSDSQRQITSSKNARLSRSRSSARFGASILHEKPPKRGLLSHLSPLVGFPFRQPTDIQFAFRQSDRSHPAQGEWCRKYQ
jgi:hypothetical protein